MNLGTWFPKHARLVQIMVAVLVVMILLLTLLASRIGT